MGSFRDFAQDIVGVMNMAADVVLAFIAVALLFVGFWYFIYKGGSDEKARATGRTALLWGIVAAAVAVSLWGIVEYVQGLLNLN